MEQPLRGGLSSAGTEAFMISFTNTVWTRIFAAGGGNDEARNEIAQRYRPAVVAYIRRRGLTEDAEDLAQEVFLRLFEQEVIQRASPDLGRFRSLLCAVSRNVIGHHLQREGAQKRGSGRVRQLGDIDVADDSNDDDDLFDREWIAHLIAASLEDLSVHYPRYHEALQLTLMGSKSRLQVAEAMGKSEANVRNYVHRGKRKLIENLRERVRDYSASHADYAEELRYLEQFLPS